MCGNFCVETKVLCCDGHGNTCGENFLQLLVGISALSFGDENEFFLLKESVGMWWEFCVEVGRFAPSEMMSSFFAGKVIPVEIFCGS